MQTFDEYKDQFNSVEDTPFATGGYKEVYGAKHNKFSNVVVKVIKKVDERAKREISIVQNNNFSNVPRIFQVDNIEYEGNLAIALIEERIIGSELKDFITQGNRYNLEQAVEFLRTSLEFIEQISTKNIVHRDIKPANIIIGDDGKVWFLDFGIARILDADSITNTGEGGPMTPGYAAPEVFMGGKGKITTQADLFSIGVVTYELITGINPYLKNAQNLYSIMMNTATITPVQHKIKGDTQSMFVGLLSSLLKKNQASRVKTAKDALGWLNRIEDTFNYGGDE